MLDAASRQFRDADAGIFVAAVADYTTGAPMPHKQPKKLTGLTIPLVPTHDIAKDLCSNKTADQRCIGFALETQDGLAKAQSKMERKNFDGIVLNGVSSFGCDSGHFTWLQPDATPAEWGDLSKAECAARIIERLTIILPKQPPS
jgi:phosphopantothenoylcysteine decarboxylase/phosphopantothenate--cysteine ligase